jgi:hypothetical protein
MKESKISRSVEAQGDSARRGQLLREQPVAIGVGWARALCGEAMQSRGSVEGGWPGTVPEARMRVLRTLPEQLTTLGLAPLGPAELATVTSAVYAHARQHWQKATKSSRTTRS